MKLSGDLCVTHQNQGPEKIGPCRRKCEFPENPGVSASSRLSLGRVDRIPPRANCFYSVGCRFESCWDQRASPIALCTDGEVLGLTPTRIPGTSPRKKAAPASFQQLGLFSVSAIDKSFSLSIGRAPVLKFWNGRPGLCWAGPSGPENKGNFPHSDSFRLPPYRVVPTSWVANTVSSDNFTERPSVYQRMTLLSSCS